MMSRPMKSTESFRPRLVHGKAARGVPKVGYLRLKDEGPLMLIGPIDKPEYKLIQLLFNPTNTNKGKFHPVVQTTERVVVGLFEDSAKSKPDTVIARTLKSIQKTEAGKFLTFEQSDNRIVMRVNTEEVG